MAVLSARCFRGGTLKVRSSPRNGFGPDFGLCRRHFRAETAIRGYPHATARRETTDSHLPAAR